MNKCIIIISTIFLFSIVAFAQSVETKDDVNKSNSENYAVDILPATEASNTDAVIDKKKRPSIPPPIEERRKINKTDSQKSLTEIKQKISPSTESKKQPSFEIIPQNQNAADQKSVQKMEQKLQKSAETKSSHNNTSSIGTSPVSGQPLQIPPKVTNVIPPPPPPPLKDVAPVLNGNISLNFDDADIYSVIQTVFNEILKVNYIIDPKVKGRVTFRSVEPVPKENVLPIMEVVLRLNGVGIVEENSLYRIIAIGDMAREPSPIGIGRDFEKVEIKGKGLLQVVPVEHVQSSEIIKLITPFTSTNAVVVDVPKTNHIIIVDTDANIKRILQLVKIFDSEQQKSKGPQIYVHHIQNGQAKDICSLLQQIFFNSKATGQTGVSITAPSSPSSTSTSAARPQVHTTASSQGRAEVLISDMAKIYADEIINAVVILGTPEDYEIIKNTITKLDIVPRQVLIEGTIAQLQLSDKMSLGLAWSLKTNMLNMDPVTISLNPSSLSSDTSKTSGLSLIGIDSGKSVRAVINALASKSKAKLLASPHIMVSDNKEARIQVGQQVPLVTSETYGSTSTSVPIRTIQYKDIGMILKVKPQINDSGLVALQISQEVSTYSKDTLYTDETQIILNKTEASTNLVVQDGHTIVIGGLIREDDSKARQGVPFIYKIPVLGYLFGNTDNDASRTELVILLTPHVIKDQQDAKNITNQFADKVTDKQMNNEIKNDIHDKAKEYKK